MSNKIFTDYALSSPATGDFFLIQRGADYYRLNYDDIANEKISGTTGYSSRFTSAHTIETGTFTDDGDIVTLPDEKTLNVIGNFRLQPNAGAGKVLISDASGYASWQTAASGISGLTTNKYTKATSSTAIGNAMLSDDGTNVFVPANKFITSEGSKGTICFSDTNNALLLSNDYTTYAKAYLWLGNSEALFGWNNTNLSLSNTSAVLAGDTGFQGLKYSADYSANYVARSLVDKAYVDALLLNQTWKAVAKVATTANITLSGAQTIDGVSVIAGDRVLVKDQTTATENGIYVCAAGAWSRASDADTGVELVGATLWVNQGATNGDRLFTCNNDSITIGSTAITFVQSGAGVSYTSGTGINIAGSVISISSSYTGQTSITTLGTVTTGTWNASANFQVGNLKVNNPANTFAYIINGAAIVADRTVTFPLLSANDTFVTAGATQTISSKTIGNSNSVTQLDNIFTIQDNGDVTKQFRFEASGITTATTRTYTMPDVNTTLLGRTGTNAVNQLAFFNDVNQVTSSSNLDFTSNCLRSLKIGATATDVAARFGHASFQSFSADNSIFGFNYTYNGGRYATGFAAYIQHVNSAITFNVASASAAAGLGGLINTNIMATTATGVRIMNGSSNAAAYLHIGAGSTAAGTAPVKLVSGPLNTTAEAGALEFITDDLTFTCTTGATRKRIADYSYRAITTARTLDGSDELIDCTSGTFTITLPTAVGFNKKYTIKNSGTGIISIATTSSQTIDGLAASTYTLLQGDHLELRSDGANWDIISGGRKVYTYTVTIPAANFRTIGSVPIDLTPSITVPTNCILTVDKSSIVVRKKSGASVYNFTNNIYIGYYGFALKTISNAVFNSASGNLIMESNGPFLTGSGSIIGEPIIVTTDGATDATTGIGDVVITYRYYLSNLN